MKPKIFVASYYNETIIKPALKRLSQYTGEILMGNDLGRSFTEKEIISALKDFDVVIAAEEPYNEKVFSSNRNLLMVARDGVGLNSIDIDAATEYGVVVTNAPVLHETVADLAFGLLIAVVRKLRICDKGMREGRWTDRDSYTSTDVNGKTLGLFGFGRVAKGMARRAKGFNMEVIACHTTQDKKAAAKLGVKLVDFEELLRSSDILSLHTPLTPQTKCLIGNKEFSIMKDGVYIINSSRGEIINEEDLVNSLKTGKVAGAGLDVVCEEPPDLKNPLFSFENVIFTPHIASDTFDTFLRVFESVVDDIIALFSGQKPKNIINPNVLKNEKLKSIIQ